MQRLPLITALGGINPAGRSSCHHGYRRLLLDALSDTQRLQTLTSLAALTNRLRRLNGRWQDDQGLPCELDERIAALTPSLLEQTLIRKLETGLFDPDRLPSSRRVELGPEPAGVLEFTLPRRQLPDPLPPGWQVTEGATASGSEVRVRTDQSFGVLMEARQRSSVHSAGQLPKGFAPETLYQSRNHPRGLQLTVYGASDAINSMGIDWDVIRQRVPADQICVYAGSGMGQLDGNGYGGMIQARLQGRRVSSKQLPLGYAEMPADFINAYLLGNLGTTGTSVAACATFLYNLRQAARDIQTGTHRVAVVGTSEAPLLPEIFEGFAAMGALADDEGLRVLDRLPRSAEPDYRRACRPFAANCGFTLAESAQFVVLMEETLALDLGANILGAVNEVYVNADGHKKSIASPGLGNYLSLAKAAAATRNVLGDRGLRERTYVQAHGTGTPQNRVTESEILNRIAGIFGIDSWPVTAIKSYIGHSLASSAGDQLAASLGFWSDGWLPGILTTSELADDVSHSHLDFLLSHRELGPEAMDAVLINSKGFGGNNASASILAPHVTESMLAQRYGQQSIKEYRQRNESVRAATSAYDEAACSGVNQTIYRFDHEVLDGADIVMDRTAIRLRAQQQEVRLPAFSGYADMVPDERD